MPDDQKPSVLFDPKKVERRRCFLINLFYFAIIILIAVLVAGYLFQWMLPFVLAFLVASWLQRPLKWLVRKTKISKKFFSVILVILFVLFLAAIVVVIFWQLIRNIISFTADDNNILLAKEVIQSLSDGAQNLIIRFSHLFPDSTIDYAQQSITETSTNLVSYLTKFFTSAAGALVTFSTTKLPMILVSFIIWIIASIFLTIDYLRVTAFLKRQIPNRYTDMVKTVRILCTETIFKLLRAYLLLMLITFAELSISFAILGIHYFLFIAALIALVDILPVLGTGTILIPWAFISLVMGNFPIFFGISLTYIIITFVRNILEPRLVSRQIGLNPLVTLFFMFLGLKAIGIVGILLFPIIVMILVQLQKMGKIKLWK